MKTWPPPQADEIQQVLDEGWKYVTQFEYGKLGFNYSDPHFLVLERRKIEFYFPFVFFVAKICQIGRFQNICQNMRLQWT